MKHYKLQGKEVKVPTSWSEATYDMFVKFQSKKFKTDAEIISLFTGVHVEDLRGKHIGGKYNELINDLMFVKESIDIDYIPPRSINFKSKNIKLPTDIGKETVGQYSDLMDIIREAKEQDSLENILTACSIYIQPLIDGDYSLSRAKEVKEDISQLPADFVFCMGGFFLTKALGLPNGFMKTYQRAVTPMMRFQQGIRHIVKRLAL